MHAVVRVVAVGMSSHEKCCRFAGYFQSNPGSSACINCDDMGDFYQEESAKAACEECPENTRRYNDLNSGIGGNNRSACQCKENYWRHDGLLGRECWLCPEGGVCQGKAALPYPDKNYYAVVNEDEFAASKSIKLSDARGISTIPSDPPIFVQCGQGRCKGGPRFECEHGYRGTACAECSSGQFYWNGKCDTDCKDIEPQGAVTVFGIIGVIIVWIVLNKSAGGKCGPPMWLVLPPSLPFGQCFLRCADSSVLILGSRTPLRMRLTRYYVACERIVPLVPQVYADHGNDVHVHHTV
jgi:hypothetical protein